MDKLKMAHDWAMKHGDPENFKLTIAEAWEYADMMQAEADKRTVEPDVGTTDGSDFQIDWSQAPEDANWWAMDADSNSYWFFSKPSMFGINGFWEEGDDVFLGSAPSFNYQGAWQDSLCKRP